MMVFMDRSQRGPDPWLTWKVRSFQAGAVLAVLGMITETQWLIAVATGVLAVGFVLRFVPHPSAREDEAEESV